jgi:hypothetical protein
MFHVSQRSRYIRQPLWLPIGPGRLFTKSGTQTGERREIVATLRTKLTNGESVPDLAASTDLVDAAVCVLAGADYVSGRAMNPEDRTLRRPRGLDLDSRTEHLTAPSTIRTRTFQRLTKMSGRSR